MWIALVIYTTIGMLGGGALGKLHVHFPTDVLCSGVWEVLQDFQEPELKSLAAALQSILCLLAELRPPLANMSMPF